MYVNALIKRAGIFAGQHNLNKCKTCLEKALIISPHSTDILVHRARVSQPCTLHVMLQQESPSLLYAPECVQYLILHFTYHLRKSITFNGMIHTVVLPLDYCGNKSTKVHNPRRSLHKCIVTLLRKLYVRDPCMCNGI